MEHSFPEHYLWPVIFLQALSASRLTPFIAVSLGQRLNMFFLELLKAICDCMYKSQGAATTGTYIKDPKTLFFFF